MNLSIYFTSILLTISSYVFWGAEDKIKAFVERDDIINLIEPNSFSHKIDENLNNNTQGQCEYFPFTSLINNPLQSSQDKFRILQSAGYKYEYGTWVKTSDAKFNFPREIKVYGNHLEMFISKELYIDFLTSLFIKGYRKTEFGYQCDCSYFMNVTDYGKDYKLGFYETKCDIKKPPKAQYQSERVYVCDGPYATKFHSNSNCRGLSNCSGQILYFNDEQEALDEDYDYCGICWH